MLRFIEGGLESPQAEAWSIRKPVTNIPSCLRRNGHRYCGNECKRTINFLDVQEELVRLFTASLNTVLFVRTSLLPTDLWKLLFSTFLPNPMTNREIPPQNNHSDTEAAEMFVCLRLLMECWKALKLKIKVRRKCLPYIPYIMHDYKRAQNKASLPILLYSTEQFVFHVSIA